MLKMEEYFVIRELHAQGLSITAISDKTGFDRKTVRKYLDLTTIPEPKPRSKRESKLDKYKDYILSFRVLKTTKIYMIQKHLQ